MKPNAVRYVALICPAVLLGLVALAPAASLPEPELPSVLIPRVTFGDEWSVNVLAEAMEEEDPLIRERAVCTLGETHNPAAAPIIREAIDAPEATVQAAAAIAAAELGVELTGDVLRTALGPDRDPRVILEGLQGIRRTRYAAAAGDVRAVLARDSALVQTEGLRTLTALGEAADARRLAELLAGPHATVRLEACNNAALASPTDELAATLASAVRADPSPAVRGAALAALGRLDYSAAEGLALQASRDSHPLLRRGAVRAWESGGATQRVREMLRDTSPPVLLEATQAVGRMGDRQSVARLYEILLRTRDNDLHHAALHSLIAIDGDAVHDGAVAAFVAEADRLPSPDQGKRLHVAEKILERNLRALSLLLTHFRSTRELDRRLVMMSMLRIDSPVQLDLIPSIAAAGEDRAVGPLMKLLALCKRQGARWLHAQTLPIPPPVEYNDFVAEQVVHALAALDPAQSATLILETATTKYQSGRLSRPAVAAAQWAVALAGAGARPGVEAFLLEVLTDRDYAREASFEASKAAGKLKYAEAEPVLREILTERRWNRWSMRAAAWALQEITGRTPEIGDPIVRENSDWLIRKAGR